MTKELTSVLPNYDSDEIFVRGNELFILECCCDETAVIIDIGKLVQSLLVTYEDVQGPPH